MTDTIYWTGREAVQTVTTMICIADVDDMVQVIQDDTGERCVDCEMSTDTLAFAVLSHLGFHGMKSVTVRQYDHGTHTANEIVLHHGGGEVEVYLLVTGN
jgi:hypothetical protein